MRLPYAAGGSIRFVYDGQDVLVDEDAHTGQATAKYLNGLGIDNKLRQKVNNQAQYFLSDHLGSTNALTDGNGAITAQTNYHAFGNQTATLPTRYGYTGRERDDFTGLMHYRARQYSAELGRFISEDPIGFKGGDVNLYGYVKNNPQNFKDPSGKIPIAPILIIGGVIGGEAGLHYGLGVWANQYFPGGEPNDKKRHCFVNCVSIRLHLGFPMPAFLAGMGKELYDLSWKVPVWWRTGQDPDGEPNPFIASKRDMLGNFYGMTAGYLLHKSCVDLCRNCEIPR